MPQHIKAPEKLELVFPTPGQPWGGLNRYDTLSRYTIGDGDSDDLINWLPMGNSMRQVPSISSAIATLPATAIWLSAQTLNGGIYIFALCSDGNCYQVPIPGGGRSKINGGTSLSSSTDITNWQGTEIILTDPQASGGTVYSWDGTNFRVVFTNQPANYLAVYQGRIFGAFNSTVWFTDVNTYTYQVMTGTLNGTVNVTGLTSTATLAVGQPVSGTDIAAGTYIVAIPAGGTTLTLSQAATGSTTTSLTFGQFSLGGSAGSFTITDSACALPILALVSFAGSLMIFGGNWIQILSNMYVYGSPPVATFTLYQLESQIGCINKWSIIPLGSALYFANSYGVWVLNGSVPQMVSGPIDGFFNQLGASTSYSAGYTQIYGVPCLFWNAQWTGDPASVNTNFGLTNDGQWFRSNFGTITFITSTVSAANPTLWGTDGTHIFSIFTNTTAQVTSTYQSKYWNLGQPLWEKLLQKFGFITAITAPATATLTVYSENGVQLAPPVTDIFAVYIQWINNMGQIVSWKNNSNQIIQWAGNTTQYAVWQFNSEGRCRAFGVNLQVISTQAFFQAVVVQTEWSQAVWGS